MPQRTITVREEDEEGAEVRTLTLEADVAYVVPYALDRPHAEELARQGLGRTVGADR